MKNIGTLLILAIILNSFTISAQLKNPRSIPYTWNTDTLTKNIDLSELTVVLPRNSFPAIDYPTFIDKEEGIRLFFSYEPVIAVSINGESKAYPLNMLTMHEISNDSLGGVPILPTFCPLCNSSLVFDRRLKFNGKEYLLDFEVSGMLRNSDMIMADKQTETWWQQLSGAGLAGELTGAELELIPSMVISVHDFFERYPDGKILSPETGTKAEEKYGTNPYENYDDLQNKPYARFYDHSKINNKLPAMERIITIKGENGYKIYPFSIISTKGLINDFYANKNIVIFYDQKTVSVLDKKNISESKKVGSATVFSSMFKGEKLSFTKKGKYFKDDQTESLWDITGRCIKGELKGSELEPQIHANHFAFAWLTFYPESDIYSE